MSEHDDTKSQPTRYPPLSPHLTVRDGGAAIRFYEQAFGARVIRRQDAQDGARVLHAALALPNGGVFMLNDDFPEMGGSRTPERFGGTPVTLHLDLDDVDAVWQQALAAGAEPMMPLADQFWGARYGVVRDPFGHRWSLATEKREVPAREADAAAERLFPAKP